MTHLARCRPGRLSVISLTLAVLLGLMGFNQPAHPASAQAGDRLLDRAAVVQQLYAALTSGDVDGAMAFITDNATWIGGAKCPAPNPCQGAAAVRANVQDTVDVHSFFALTGVQVLGSVVIARFDHHSDATQAAGVDRIVVTVMAQVPQDRVTLLVATPDLNDPQTLAFFTRPPSPVSAP